MVVPSPVQPFRSVPARPGGDRPACPPMGLESTEIPMSTARTIPVWAPVEEAAAAWFDRDPPAGAVDVVVVGAGIAGLTTAACLLR